VPEGVPQPHGKFIVAWYSAHALAVPCMV